MLAPLECWRAYWSMGGALSWVICRDDGSVYRISVYALVLMIVSPGPNPDLDLVHRLQGEEASGTSCHFQWLIIVNLHQHVELVHWVLGTILEGEGWPASDVSVHGTPLYMDPGLSYVCHVPILLEDFPVKVAIFRESRGFTFVLSVSSLWRITHCHGYMAFTSVHVHSESCWRRGNGLWHENAVWAYILVLRHCLEVKLNFVWCVADMQKTKTKTSGIQYQRLVNNLLRFGSCISCGSRFAICLLGCVPGMMFRCPVLLVQYSACL